MIELAKMKADKDSENKKFISGIVGKVTLGVGIAVTAVAAVLGAQTSISAGTSEDNDDNNDLDADLSFAAPSIGAEKHQKRKNFQTAKEHIRGEDELREPTVVPVIAGCADQLKTGADIVEAGCDRRNIRADGVAVNGDERKAQQEDHKIYREIGIHGVGGFLANHFAVHADDLHAAGIECLSDRAADAL